MVVYRETFACKYIKQSPSEHTTTGINSDRYISVSNKIDSFRRLNTQKSIVYEEEINMPKDIKNEKIGRKSLADNCLHLINEVF